MAQSTIIVRLFLGMPFAFSNTGICAVRPGDANLEKDKDCFVQPVQSSVLRGWYCCWDRGDVNLIVLSPVDISSSVCHM